MTSVYFYLEYLVTMLVSLRMQGFRNPAIFALDYTPVPEVSFNGQLAEATQGWDYLVQNYTDCPIAVAGDSNGATLALSLLLHIARPYPSAPLVAKKPDAAVLISPWTQLFSVKQSNKSDYLSPKLLLRYAEKYVGEVGDTTNVYYSPGLCRSREWWTQAFPELGIYLTYGQEEILAPEIEQLEGILSKCGRIKIEAQPNQIHAWPVIMNFLGRDRQSREAGIELTTSNLAKMVLWHSSTDPVLKAKLHGLHEYF
jgi:acetyl esterase/lipase